MVPTSNIHVPLQLQYFAIVDCWRRHKPPYNNQLRYQLLQNTRIAPPLIIENHVVAVAENQAIEDALPLDDEHGNGKC